MLAQLSECTGLDCGVDFDSGFYSQFISRLFAYLSHKAAAAVHIDADSVAGFEDTGDLTLQKVARADRASGWLLKRMMSVEKSSNRPSGPSSPESASSSSRGWPSACSRSGERRGGSSVRLGPDEAVASHYDPPWPVAAGRGRLHWPPRRGARAAESDSLLMS